MPGTVLGTRAIAVSEADKGPSPCGACLGMENWVVLKSPILASVWDHLAEFGFSTILSHRLLIAVIPCPGVIPSPETQV